MLGQSGSGKTMTCKAVMGLLDKTQFLVRGRILYGTHELLTMSTREKRMLYGGEIALIPQNPMTALDPSMKIGNQMAETLCQHSSFSKHNCLPVLRDALRAAGLETADNVLNSFPHTLSGGMLQRVIIAMALMTHAKLIIADEPTTALDVVHRNATVEALSQMRSNGSAILMITHDFSVAAQLGGKLAVMKEGRILESGNVGAILSHPQEDYTKALIEASDLAQSVERGRW